MLNAFRVGDLDALVAMKCLDEGIDVPACRTAYILASARNPKQFIQRRGRILRRSAGKEVAIVHDFLPILPFDKSSPMDSAERSLVIAELGRVSEFANLAQNPQDVLDALKPILQKYDVFHYLVVQ
jgi:superfamily II DNA or RNA helicase